MICLLQIEHNRISKVIQLSAIFAIQSSLNYSSFTIFSTVFCDKTGFLWWEASWKVVASQMASHYHSPIYLNYHTVLPMSTKLWLFYFFLIFLLVLYVADNYLVWFLHIPSLKNNCGNYVFGGNAAMSGWV